jgi:hypothetical protein
MDFHLIEGSSNSPLNNSEQRNGVLKVAFLINELMKDGGKGERRTS